YMVSDINLVISMKLTSKISIILVVLVLMSGCLIGILCVENVSDAFDDYLFDTYEVMLDEWARTFVAYYSYHGSWNGVEYFGRVVGLEQSGVVLSDLNGRILYHFDRDYVGRHVPQEIFSRGYLLRVDHNVIGILYPAALFSDTFTVMQEEFAKAMMGAIAKGVLIISLFAILIGIGLSVSIATPLKDLTQATKRMAKGDFSEPLPIYGSDEIGDLSRSFNSMANELEKSTELRQQMVADISHELRTPLTVLSSKLEFTLEQNTPLEMEEVAVLYDEVIRLRGLVGELQDLSKLEAGRAMLDKTLISFPAYFSDFQVLLEAEAESREIDLRVDLASDAVYCYADPKRLKQIILNLVNNAFRYTAEGGAITIRTWQDAYGFYFSVQDTGIGIAPDELERIFERFYRTDQSRHRESGGSGLGLAITKALVDAHGGWIKAESQLQAGSIFTVWLPHWTDTKAENNEVN
ncbi:MAG: HAMP domain-containing protein, partial [Peptococcaceae bacterium]|nr:HAMP domain-containing protein [Peptococcaceae bacterium]